MNQYAELETPLAVMSALTEQGATVWLVDLLESLLLQRTSRTIRLLDGTPVSRLLEAAVAEVAGTDRPILLVAADRMAIPALRGLHTWQQQTEDVHAVAGAALFFPNFFRGTPIAGEEPELFGILAATRMPLMIFQPELGTGRERLPTILSTLHEAGSPTHVWMIPGVRDYYLLYSRSARNRALESSAGIFPEAIQRAIEQTPGQLVATAHLLAATPRLKEVLHVDLEREMPLTPAIGLVPRESRTPPDYVLWDAHGEIGTQQQNLGRITLVNFWATWCPPCVHEIPSMNRLAGAYDPDDFAIVSINFREEAPHILAFMRRVAVDFPVLLDVDGQVSRQWGVFAFPSSFLLDRTGQVRYSVNTAIAWDTDEVREVIDLLLREP